MKEYVFYLHLKEKDDFIGLGGLGNIGVKLIIITFFFNYKFIFD